MMIKKSGYRHLKGAIISPGKRKEKVMRNRVHLLLAFFMLLLLLTACGNKTETPKFIAGTYKVTFDEPDPTNWRAYLILQISEDKITSAVFDYEGTGPNEGKKKSEDKAYNEAMLKTTGTNPVTYLNALTASLVASQDPDEVSLVSGATTSSNDFILFAKEALKSARSGDDQTIILSQPMK